MTVTGIDVSKWQGKIDWAQVKNAGYTWSACRTWDRQEHQVDETFAYNRDGQAFATWKLLYYWLEPGRVAEGVDEFFEAVGELRPGEGAMLDAEEEGITVAECIEWCELVEARTGVPCAVYTGGYTADGTIWHSDELFDGKRARIFAAYCDEDDAVRHAQGKAWDAWQYSCTGTVPGVDADCDLDRIDNPDAFTACLRTESPTEEYEVDDATIEKIAKRAAELVWAEQVSTSAGVKAHGWVAGQNYTLTQRSVKASEEAAANTRNL
jgi:hypothetical protein